MPFTHRAWFRAINDSLHVLAAGVVPGAALAVTMARSSAKATLDPVVFTGLVQSWTWVLMILMVGIVVLVITGAIRIGYRTLNVVPEALPAKGRAALAKHLFFVALLIYSAVLAFTAVQP